jgi:hypothetical protein
MDNLLNIVLEAHHPQRNHHRRYEIIVGKDLLDDWTVKIRFGRSGQYGRVLQFASPKAEEMRCVIRDRLRRRLSAPKRIGCSYRLSAFSTSRGVDPADWLPGNLMASLLTGS